MIHEYITNKQTKIFNDTNKETVIQEIMKLYTKQLYLLALSYIKDPGLAEDISQDVFYKCYKNLHNFRGEAAIKSWLYRITINTAKDYLKKKSYKQLKISQDSFEHKLESPSTENEVIKKEEAETVLQSVLSLPSKYREVMVLYYFHDMKVEEIKHLLKLNPNTVKTRLSRGRELLKKNITI